MTEDELREVVEQAFRQATYFPEFTDAGLFVDRQIAHMHPERFSRQRSGIFATDPTCEGRKLTQFIMRELTSSWQGVRARLFQGATGNGKSCVLGMFQNRIDRVRRDNGRLIISTGVIDCRSVALAEGHPLRSLVANILVRLHVCFRKHYAHEMHEYETENLSRNLGDLWHQLEVESRKPFLSGQSPEVQFDHLERYLANFCRCGFLPVILLDEFSNFWRSIANQGHRNLIINSLFGRFLDHGQSQQGQQSSGPLLCVAILNEHYEEIFRPHGIATGHSRRTMNSRVLLEALTDDEVAQLVTLFAEKCTAPLLGLTHAQTRDEISRLRSEMGYISPGEIVSELASDLKQRLDLKEQDPEWLQYQKKCKTHFLGEARRICAERFGAPGAVVEGSYRSGVQKYGRNVDHYVEARTARGPLHFYGEVSKSTLNAEKYHAYRGFIDAVPANGDTSFIILFGPKVESTANQRAKAEKVTCLEVPLDSKDDEIRDHLFSLLKTTKTARGKFQSTTYKKLWETAKSKYANLTVEKTEALCRSDNRIGCEKNQCCRLY